jgi:predicted transcriptional regulator
MRPPRNTDLGPLFETPFETPSVPVDTSVAAAEAIRPSAAAIRERVADLVSRCGDFGATEQEIEAALALPGNTVRPRLWELEKAGQVVKSIKTRPTRAGRQARVYVALSRAPGLASAKNCAK